jgi:hypothetical protein
MPTLSPGEKLASFIESEIPFLILKDLKEWRLFSEMDMHAVIYYHIRRAIRDREEWMARCNVWLRIAGIQPDIVIFNLYKPQIIMQINFKILEDQTYFPRQKLEADRNKIKKLRKIYPELRKGYLISVHDSNGDYTLKRDEEWEKYFYKEIFIDVHRKIRGYKQWKKDWSTIKANQSSE